MLPARIQLPPDFNLQALLTETFEQYSINRLQYYIWRWYRAAMENKPYHFCQCPARVTDLHRLVELLILLAAQQETALPPADKNAHPVMVSDAYYQDIIFNKGLNKVFEQYERVIRHLYEEEAANPALFFVRFFRFKSPEEWLQIMDDWMEFALYPHGMDEVWNFEEMPEALELLMGLCESFYLIWKQLSAPAEAGNMPETTANPAQQTSGMVDTHIDNNELPLTPDDILYELFDRIDLEQLQFELWQWFLSIFRREPFSFRKDPSIVLFLNRMMLDFVSFASQWLRDENGSIPETDASATDRERFLNIEKLLDQYAGRVTVLTLEETKYPGLFFRRFFTNREAKSWEYLLNDWMQIGLGYSSITNNCDVEDMPEAYELLKGLSEACWLMHQQFMEDEDEVEDEVIKEPGEAGNKAETPVFDDDLQAIIEMIRQSIDVEMIFLLGKFSLLPAALGHEYCLLVLGNYKNGKPMDELESIIRNRSHELPPVFATVMQTNKVAKLLQNGNWFMHRWCAPEKLVYDAGTTTLPYMPGVKPPTPKLMEEIFRLHFGKATSFLSGAQSFFEQAEYALCSFMLHQCMESALMAMLVPAMQHVFKTHSLHKLLCMVRHFSPALCAPFPRDTEAEIILFQLLQKAYIHARYKDNFTISPEQCTTLIERVTQVIDMLEGEFEGLLKGIHG